MEKTREEERSGVKEVKTGGKKGEHMGRRVQEVNQNTGGGELLGRGKRR